MSETASGAAAINVRVEVGVAGQETDSGFVGDGLGSLGSPREDFTPPQESRRKDRHGCQLKPAVVTFDRRAKEGKGSKSTVKEAAAKTVVKKNLSRLGQVLAQVPEHSRKTAQQLDALFAETAHAWDTNAKSIPPQNIELLEYFQAVDPEHMSNEAIR